MLGGLVHKVMLEDLIAKFYVENLLGVPHKNTLKMST